MWMNLKKKKTDVELLALSSETSYKKLGSERDP